MHSEPWTPDHMDDEALLDLVQRQTFRYFWDYAHPNCGLARDRGNPDRTTGNDLISIGGSGFGVMAIIVATERGWIERREAVERLAAMLGFLDTAEQYNGVFPHYIDGNTGREISLWSDNAGADVVETAYLVQGLLCARQYFANGEPEERALAAKIDALWRAVNWQAHVENDDIMLWHWLPTKEHQAFQRIEGWNECLITYVLAAMSPTYPIDARPYHEGWARGKVFRNGRDYYGVELPLGPDLGGPLFFAHYSFLGLDPRGLRDRYADYWQQNHAHTLVNYSYCVANPKGFKGYGPKAWGLTASDGDKGYRAFAPDQDEGVIAPTAALSSLPYTPAHSLAALRHFYFDLGPRLWGRFGFADAFNETVGWVAEDNLAINQGPIIAMIENYRSGLLWRLFMSCPEVKPGLEVLGFTAEPLVA
ncbi:glucoamylase family protein [Rhodomicrobium sp.]|uniref:glucoamylase family protein n=1 Tax=Rhodomicrobium sp. TaxID=2720632 RepID=UPI0039E3EC6D